MDETQHRAGGRPGAAGAPAAPESPAPPRETPVAALARALFGSALGRPRSCWRAAVAFERRGSQKVFFEYASVGALDARVRAFAAANAAVPGWSVNLHRHVGWKEEFAPPLAPASRRVMTALRVDADPADLFKRGGAFYQPSVLDGCGRPVRHLIAPQRLEAAARLCHEQALSFRPAPSVVADVDGVLYLYLLLKHAVEEGTSEHEAVIQLAFRYADLLHGGGPGHLAYAVQAPLVFDAEEGPRIAMRILRLRSDLLYEIGQLEEAALRLAAVRVEPLLCDTGRNRTKPPIAMRLRTLMYGWQLEDLEVAGEIKDVLVGSPTLADCSIVDPRAVVLEALAGAGYGAEDACLVLSDTRFAPARAIAFTPDFESRVRQAFRAALKRAARARGLRLPYGIRKILRLPGEGTPRYLVRGGTKGSPFEIEVDHRTLMSSLRFRHALSERLGRPLYPTTPEVWDGMLRAAFADPQFLEAAPPTSTASRSLADVVAPILARAEPRKKVYGGAGEGTEPRWPVVEDGQVFFRLRWLQDETGRAIAGPPPSRGDMTRVLRSLGGGPAGSKRFGGVKRRVWSVPFRAPAMPEGGGAHDA